MTNEHSSKSAMHQRFLTISSPTSPTNDERTAAGFEPELIAILMKPVPPGQAREGHAMKERQLGELFAQLSVPEARVLHKRLTCKVAGDELVVAFDRLIVERRARLVTILGDAPRRAALARCA
ncbi:MAG: hypothetical protein H0T46_12720 [Deltaproteobacteria bacterium]|nr:hypothetical protein [Deltaproteobacteria bacterium]